MSGALLLLYVTNYFRFFLLIHATGNADGNKCWTGLEMSNGCSGCSGGNNCANRILWSSSGDAIGDTACQQINVGILYLYAVHRYYI